MEENTPVPTLPPPSVEPAGELQQEEKQTKSAVGLIIVGVVILILLIVATVLLLMASNDTTARVRDVFIIFMALESLVIGVAMIILIIQLATLINLLQNELKPIIHSTNETVNTLRGTVTFLSENLSEPVIQMNAYLAGIKQFFNVTRPRRPRR
jgi:membrane protein implicated in regulation of membrane protease activity